MIDRSKWNVKNWEKYFNKLYSKNNTSTAEFKQYKNLFKKNKCKIIWNITDLRTEAVSESVSVSNSRASSIVSLPITISQHNSRILKEFESNDNRVRTVDEFTVELYAKNHQFIDSWVGLICKNRDELPEYSIDNHKCTIYFDTIHEYKELFDLYAVNNVISLNNTEIEVIFKKSLFLYEKDEENNNNNSKENSDAVNNNNITIKFSYTEQELCADDITWFLQQNNVKYTTIRVDGSSKTGKLELTPAEFENIKNLLENDCILIEEEYVVKFERICEEPVRKKPRIN